MIDFNNIHLIQKHFQVTFI